MNRCLSFLILAVLSLSMQSCADSGGGGGTTPPSVPAGSADSTAPSQPGSLSATAMSSSQIDLSWNASTDNVGVTGYKIFRGGILIATSPTTAYSHTGLTPSTNYSYTVSAYDAAGNNSPQSGSANATTQAQQAGTITAASCSQAAVQTAVNSALDGNTVIVPTGSCTWGSPVLLSNSKGVTLQCTTAGSCVITASSQALLFDSLSGTNTRFYRITGFTLQNSSATFVIWVSGNGTLSSIRIDHNTFNVATDSVAVFFGHTQSIANYYGVIDHNTMTSPGSSTFLQIIGDTNNSPPPSQLGTGSNMFVEDNTITIPTMTNAGKGCMDSWGNGAIVWRHNNSLNCLVTTHGVTHSGGPQNIELYDNQLRVDAGSVAQGVADGYRLFHHQGSGEFIAFNNRFTAFSGKNSDPLEMTHYRSAPPAVAGYDVSLGRCDGSNPKDGNRAPASTYFGYPCWRQPGRDFAGNLMPMYVWNNRWSDTGAKIDMLVATPWGTTNPAVEDHIKPDRDYYNAVSALAQTSPPTPFNGTTGMGFGTLVNRPATCTTNALESGGGVGYFATDQGPQGTLFRCSATNTWTAWYQPYTYPHPLAQ